jgi:RHS repeat-associated protein
MESTGNVDNNITYAGYQYDEETGLYYLNARMYDPKIARFLQEDTYRGDPNDPLSLNLYTYCVNNPLVYYDPTGHVVEGYYSGTSASPGWASTTVDGMVIYYNVYDKNREPVIVIDERTGENITEKYRELTKETIVDRATLQFTESFALNSFALPFTIAYEFEKDPVGISKNFGMSMFIEINSMVSESPFHSMCMHYKVESIRRDIYDNFINSENNEERIMYIADKTGSFLGECALDGAMAGVASAFKFKSPRVVNDFDDIFTKFKFIDDDVDIDDLNISRKVNSPYDLLNEKDIPRTLTDEEIEADIRMQLNEGTGSTGQ